MENEKEVNNVTVTKKFNCYTTKKVSLNMLRSCHQMEWMHEFGPHLLVWEISATLAFAYEQCGSPDSQTDGKRHLRLDCLFCNKIFEYIKNILFCVENLLQIDSSVIKYKKHKSKNIIVKIVGSFTNS